MNFSEAVAYIDETPKFTKKNSLDHTKECLRRLGNPQNKFKVIHVAGTNGKGSTCAFITSVLREAGYSCGLFTSPHLEKINERFQINEENIDDETFLTAFDRVKKLSDEMVAEGMGHPTYFEMLFLMGMLIFAEASVDYVTLETGLGGRLDATTAVENPVVCVITSVSRDHTQYLGNTIKEIAGEKAGIIVPGVPVIYDGNNKEAAEVIRKRAEELGSPSYEVCVENTEIHRNALTGIDFSMKNDYYGDTIFNLPFVAGYQVMNGALALKTLEILNENLNIPLDIIGKGIKNTRWQGRMEQIRPGIIVDGAHNEDGVAKFLETAIHFQKEYPLTLLFSAVDDKDYKDMIKTICEQIRFENVVVTQVGGYRMVPVETMAGVFREMGYQNVYAHESVAKALEHAIELKDENGMLFCVGSLYLVGEIKTIIRERSSQEEI